jgi:hypothetical protein
MMDSGVQLACGQSTVGKVGEHNSVPLLNISAKDLLASTLYSKLPHTRIL